MDERFSQLDQNGNPVDLTAMAPLDEALELLHFAFRGLTRDADAYLASEGLGRVHHRILYILARRQRTTVGDLQAILGVTKQGLHRPLKKLLDTGYVEAERDPEAGRYKLLTLTEAGTGMERAASDRERAVVEAAFKKIDPQDRDVWYRVMRDMARRA